MDCNKCKKPLRDCDCPDIDKRMTDLRNNPNFIYKMCSICERHYERCDCEEPVWVTSHDGVSLEEAVAQPTLGDRMRENQDKSDEVGAEMAKLFHQGMNGELPEDAPEELKMALELLGKVGIKVHVLKGDPKELLGGEGQYRKMVKEQGIVNDLLQFDAFQKSGGKLN